MSAAAVSAMICAVVVAWLSTGQVQLMSPTVRNRTETRSIVSPGFGPKVVAWCLEAGVPVMPGVATPSDILQALDHGLKILKFFPAESLGGIPTLEAIAAPFGGVRFVPTGGITAANLGAYLKLPAVFAVGGSWLVAPKLIAAGRIDEITRLTREAVTAVRQARGDGR